VIIQYGRCNVVVNITTGSYLQEMNTKVNDVYKTAKNAFRKNK